MATGLVSWGQRERERKRERERETHYCSISATGGGIVKLLQFLGSRCQYSTMVYVPLLLNKPVLRERTMEGGREEKIKVKGD